VALSSSGDELSMGSNVRRSRKGEKRQRKLPQIAGASAKKVTFGEFVEDANRFLAAERDAKHAYDCCLKFKRMLPAFGHRDAESITKQEVLDWLAEQADEHNWSDATRNRYVAAFSLIYSVASPDGTKRLTIKPLGKIQV
jgi:hypothetical protein